MGEAIPEPREIFESVCVYLPRMGKYERLQRKILDGRGDASIRFRDLRRLLLRLGFLETTRGSHHLFRHPDLGLLVNLQSAGGMAKPYQVRQVRVAIMKLQEGESD